jgi:hypothetical protein
MSWLSRTISVLIRCINRSSIMPPGTWHAVYTATPSFTDGGHFFTYNTLHLTEFSRAFDHLHSEYSTNANHQVDRILSRLTLALPTVSKRRREQENSCFDKIPTNLSM